MQVLATFIRKLGTFFLKKINDVVRFEVFTAVTMMIIIFWEMIIIKINDL
jgi:hypothetical protein